MIVLMLIGFAAGLAISAVVLSAACRMVGVEPPEFIPSMLICLLVTVMTTAVPLALAVALTLLTGGPGVASHLEWAPLLAKSAPFATALNPFLSAGIYCFVLQRCSFGRGLVLWVAQLVVVGLFGVVFLGIGKGMHLLG